MRTLCVFCGSKTGKLEVFTAAARELARQMCQHHCGLVFGGGSIGLMGVIADAMLELKGDVIGVIPQGLATKEVRHPHVQDMRVVESMHARKALMADLADGFVALPGGYGTFEELFEIITWAQLGIHNKPVCVLNVAGYFDPLVQLIDSAIAADFIRPRQRELLLVADTVAELWTQLENFSPPEVTRWLEQPES